MNKLLDVMEGDVGASGQIIRYENSHLISMRDGVRLSTDFLFPAQAGPGEKLPVILMRTPYDKRRYRPGATATANFIKYHEVLTDFVRRGFVVAIQDKRGKFESEGDYFVYTKDAEDGFDTCAWIGSQHWCNGRIGGYGCSYSGDVQIILAAQRSPFLKCIIPQGASGGGRYPYVAFRLGGAIEMAMWLGWLRLYGALKKYGPPAGFTREDLLELSAFYRSDPVLPEGAFSQMREVWRSLPVIDQMKLWGAPPTGWEEFVSREMDDPWWKQQFDFVDEHHRVDVPALFENSWYDFGVAETLNEFEKFKRIAASQAVLDRQYAIISPMCHCESQDASERTVVGERDVGDARYPFHELHVAWFEYWLKGVENGVLDRPKVQYYLMGTNEWRGAEAWPPEGAQFEEWHLSSEGRANSRFGDGRLTPSATIGDRFDRFTYDPEFPTPTLGGPTCCTMAPDTAEGALDQREIEARQDVLVYTSDPLERPLTVVGPLSVILFVSSSARDTDFTAKLIDVYPDGRAFNIQEGVLRCRYREGFDRKVWMGAGEVYEIMIDMQATANTFLPGHRIRLDISSSNFPRFDRNLNTGGDNIQETTWVIAENAVHHGPRYPSRLILPVLSEASS